MIYLDNASTTCPDPRVVEVMGKVASLFYGNASSLHSIGAMAREILDSCRETIASAVNATPGEMYFTGSGTEANNLALKGTALANAHRGNHIIVSSIEHDCILKTAEWLEEHGFRLTFLPVGSEGIVDPLQFGESVTGKTILASVMHVNNEIGTIQPVEEIGRICRRQGVYFHTDACQSFGKIPVDVERIQADLLTVNAHKIHGPKGVGALYIRQGVRIQPQLHGGGQEKGMRSSTENIPGIAGFAEAVKISCSDMDDQMNRLTALRDRIISSLKSGLEGVYFNGSLSRRIPGNVNFCIDGLEGEGIRLQLLLDEEGVCVSTGSACSSNHGNNPSHVLQALGLDPFRARGGIRISLGRFSTEADADRFLEVLGEKVRQLNPIF